MNKFKLLWAVILVLSLTIFFFSCGEDDEEESVNQFEVVQTALDNYLSMEGLSPIKPVQP